MSPTGLDEEHNAEESQRLYEEKTKDKMTFLYSEAQWEKVLLSCSQFDLSEQHHNALARSLYRAINNGTAKRDRAMWRKERVEELKDLLLHIEAIDSKLTPLLEEWGEMEGEVIRPHAAVDYERAKPHLYRLATNFQRECRDLEEVTPKNDNLDVKNAENEFKRRLFAVIGQHWEAWGCEVRETNSFRDFFEAATLPVLKDTKVRRLKNVASSSIKPERNSDLRHFRSWWKELSPHKKRLMSGSLS